MRVYNKKQMYWVIVTGRERKIRQKS